MGFISSDFDPCIFISRAGNLLVAVYYVDDILAVGPQQVCDEFATLLGKQFHIVNQGQVSSFLDLSIKRESGMIFINQIEYIEKMAKRFQLENCNPTSTPLDHSLPLLKADPDSPRADQTLY
jgi:Reverse transcriptase (RNA-dependent DNA polymerase)